MAASGPAPDAAAAAPVFVPNIQAIVPATSAPATADGTGSVANDPPAVPTPEAATTVASPAPAPNPVPGVDAGALAGLPALGSIGVVAAGVPDGPAAARALLSSGTGRSVAVILALMLAILLFLSIHRRVDRSDPKLAAAASGPELARFR